MSIDIWGCSLQWIIFRLAVVLFGIYCVYCDQCFKNIYFINRIEKEGIKYIGNFTILDP